MLDMDIVLVGVGRIEGEVLEELREDLVKIFNKEIFIGKDMPEPDYAFNKERRQYLSTAILEKIEQEKSYTGFKRILAVVDHDLYVPELNFVFGQAHSKIALISLTRLRPSYYGLPEDRHLFHKRVLTEAVHELAHTYGLGHCRDSGCVMFFSNSLLDTDRKGYQFCLGCRKRLAGEK